MTQLLLQSGLVGSPWNGEGDDYWGNEPAFSPVAHPAGTVYQLHDGELGHEIGAEYASPELRDLLSRRLEDLPAIGTPFIVNKNPYNILRIPWIRMLFPDARIVALVRRPVPTYSRS